MPHQGGVPKLPRRIFEAQERGELVPTNLLTVVEYANCITGYKTLPEGTQAELDYLYVGTRRLDDVLRHLDLQLRLLSSCLKLNNTFRAFFKKKNYSCIIESGCTKLVQKL
eukprot:SAG31_NODE_67_length_28318_cov_6.493674_25_plen_111_part_00